MATATQYQPVAGSDPDGTGANSYTRPPPSYQGIFEGEPRNSEDEVPDDFKYGGNVAESEIQIRMLFIRKVYAILTGQLLLTAAFSSVSFFVPSYKSWIQSNQWMVLVSFLGALVFMGLTFWKRRSWPANILFLAAFTAMEAYTVGVAVSFYESRIVLEAVVFTLAIFIALTLFACQTKYDFTSWQPYLFGLLWVAVIFGFMASFFPYSSKMELGWGCFTALLFSGYILVDTQLVMRRYHVEEHIAASLSLYLDVVNLFLSILRIINSQNN